MIRGITGVGEGKGPIIVSAPILYITISSPDLLLRVSTMVSQPQAAGMASLRVPIVWRSTVTLTLPFPEGVTPRWLLISLNRAIHGPLTPTQLSSSLVFTLLASSLLPLTTVDCLSMVYRIRTRYVSFVLVSSRLC